MNPDQARFYLAAMIDGEGHVDCTQSKRGFWNRKIIIANTDMALIEATAECCDLIGIDYNISVRERKSPRHLPCLHLVICGASNFRTVLKHVPLRSPKKLADLQRGIETVRNRHYLNKQEQRRVLWLREEGVPAKDIAQEIGCQERTIHAILRKAREESLG